MEQLERKRITLNYSETHTHHTFTAYTTLQTCVSILRNSHEKNNEWCQENQRSISGCRYSCRAPQIRYWVQMAMPQDGHRDNSVLWISVCFFSQLLTTHPTNIANSEPHSVQRRKGQSQSVQVILNQDERSCMQWRSPSYHNKQNPLQGFWEENLGK